MKYYYKGRLLYDEDDYRERVDEPCPCKCTDHVVYRWWPHIAGLIRTSENGMIACEPFFHAVWAGEN